MGTHATILMGVEIGDHSVIAAGSVVPQFMKIPAYSMVAGVPAKIIGSSKKLLKDVPDDSLSITIPAFNEEKTIEKVVKEVVQEVSKLFKDYEILLVNDGSKDKTGKIIDFLAKKNKHIKVIHHKMNKGFTGAMKSCLFNAQKNLVFLAPADGQFNFKELHKFIEAIKGYDMVIGYKKESSEGFYRKFSSKLIYTLYQKLFNVPIREISTVFMWRKNVIDSIKIESADRGSMFLYEFFFSVSLAEMLLRFFTLSLVTFFVLMLLRSVREEVHKRERIEQLNKELESVTAKLKTQNRQLKESKARELEKAKDVAKLKDEFVFLAAHELKAPVFAIRGFLELVQDDLKKVPKTLRDNLDSIAQASEHLNRLVSDLLQVARNDAGTMAVAVTPISIVKVFDGVLDEQNVLAKKRKIQIEQTIGDAIVLADENKLKEVLTNLISNAIKYNKPNGTIFVRTKAKNGKCQIEIEDTGYGIPETEQKKIFQKFFRAGGKATEGVLGTGLGLFITKMLVEKMGGTITFTSIENKGTTFKLILPLIRDD